ncbi:hypothetical protein RRG08_034022 [Elysia crispata]|uniref:BESS domain-containing protein n=1 Tax=Elysia crispata TaxID=231223 RepID=A0AAE0XUP1_9GAST|nr:hypothetical protein RRG08_034022 [Elysia crispata]
MDATFDQNSVCSEDVQEFSASEERTFTVSPSPLNAVSSLSTVSSCPTRINPSPIIDVPTTGPSGKTPKPAKRKAEEQLLTMVQDHLKAPEEDENGAYAKTVAFKMRKLDPIQRFYAEKLMNDVLFEAGLEQLSRESYVMTRPSRLHVGQYAGSSHEVYRAYDTYDS